MATYAEQLRGDSAMPPDLRIAAITRRLKWKGGIAPVEMQAFLRACEEQRVSCVIESGRGRDAYSTQVLGEYQQLRAIRVVSMDWENRFLNKWRSRWNIRRYREIELVTGDAHQQMPLAIAKSEGPVALLVDGPKHEDAIRLLTTCALSPRVRLVALHNCTGRTWEQFGAAFPKAFLTVELGISRV